jgi:hypothetical protein
MFWTPKIVGRAILYIPRSGDFESIPFWSKKHVFYSTRLNKNQSVVGRISDSVIRRMLESQHAVQYGYRLLHPTIGVLGVM